VCNELHAVSELGVRNELRVGCELGAVSELGVCNELHAVSELGFRSSGAPAGPAESLSPRR